MGVLKKTLEGTHEGCHIQDLFVLSAPRKIREVHTFGCWRRLYQLSGEVVT